jgi:glutathione S-transferase
MAYKLVIGNKNASSWSLRPWLAMRQAGIAFEEIDIDLNAPDAKAQMLAHSPSGKVPALLVGGGRVVWDSLAIIEHLAEAYPGLWPRAAVARSLARSVSAEMHAGFPALREHCPMDFLARKPKARLLKPVAADVRRIVAIWQECRSRHGSSGGPFLFGRFSAADAMYAPVASRVRTYVPDLAPYGDDGTAAAYVEAILPYPRWRNGSRAPVSRSRRRGKLEGPGPASPQLIAGDGVHDAGKREQRSGRQPDAERHGRARVEATDALIKSRWDAGNGNRHEGNGQRCDVVVDNLARHVGIATEHDAQHVLDPVSHGGEREAVDKRERKRSDQQQRMREVGGNARFLTQDAQLPLKPHAHHARDPEHSHAQGCKPNHRKNQRSSRRHDARRDGADGRDHRLGDGRQHTHDEIAAAQDRREDEADQQQHDERRQQQAWQVQIPIIGEAGALHLSAPKSPLPGAFRPGADASRL